MASQKIGGGDAGEKVRRLENNSSSVDVDIEAVSITGNTHSLQQRTPYPWSEGRTRLGMTRREANCKESMFPIIMQMMRFLMNERVQRLRVLLIIVLMVVLWIIVLLIIVLMLVNEIVMQGLDASAVTSSYSRESKGN